MAENKSIRKWIIGVLIVALAGGLYWRLHRKPRAIAEAHVGEPTATIWSTTAQVRQSVAQLHWGDQVEVLAHSGTQARVRTPAGVTGWMDGRVLLDGASWQNETHLLSQSRAMPPQAAGRTKVFTNVRLEAGRDATRIYQLPGGVPVAILARAVADAPAATAGSGAPGAEKDEGAKREDWLLISAPASKGDAADASAQGESAQESQAYLVTGNDAQQDAGGSASRQRVPPVAGWVLGRFIELDLPQTLRDYATSAGMRPVAWFVLNHVASAGGEKPQYLVAGTHGGEGQACDFTLIRVYTWGAARERYETAFVESDVCGFFPIRVGKQAGTGDPEFRYTGLTEKEPRQERIYVMRQTVVRREREGAPVPGKKK